MNGSYNAMVPLGQVLSEVAKIDDGWLEVEFDNEKFVIIRKRRTETIPNSNGSQSKEAPDVKVSERPNR